MNDIPFIPTTEGVDWYQYDTTNIGGWPTPSNPYAQPSPYSFPDNGQVVLDAPVSPGRDEQAGRGRSS